MFDFDGVLADTVEVKTDAFAEIYRPFGEDVVRRVTAHHRANGGMSRFEKFRLYHREFLGKVLTSQQLEELCDRFAALVVEKVVQSPEIPGANEFVMRSCRSGRLCAIDSGTPESEIGEIVSRRGMAAYFSAVKGAPASKVQNLAELLLYFEMTGADTVFFGDAESDYVAAQECGAGFVGLGKFMRQFAPARRVEFPTFNDFSCLLEWQS